MATNARARIRRPGSSHNDRRKRGLRRRPYREGIRYARSEYRGVALLFAISVATQMHGLGESASRSCLHAGHLSKRDASARVRRSRGSSARLRGPVRPLRGPPATSFPLRTKRRDVTSFRPRTAYWLAGGAGAGGESSSARSSPTRCTALASSLCVTPRTFPSRPTIRIVGTLSEPISFARSYAVST